MDYIKEKMLEKYLKVSKKLNEIFKELDYCSNCLVIKSSNVGCCNDNYYLAKGLLSIKGFEIIYEKIKNIKGEKKENSCDYITKKGCLLNELKNPFCLSFACSEFKSRLKKDFSINYDDGLILIYLEGILSNKLENQEYDDFNSLIDEWLNKILKTKKIN